MTTAPTTDSAPSEPKRRGRPPGFKGTSNRQINYQCATCARTFDPSELFAKRVVFVNIKTKRTVLSRTTKWVCEPCMHGEPEWHMEPRMSSPGFADVVKSE